MTTDISPARARPGQKRETRGLVIVNTGEGKGKTTAALGLALRAAGNDLKILIIQFIKGRWKTGESQSLQLLSPNVDLIRTGLGFTIERLRDQRIPLADHEMAATDAFSRAAEVVRSGEYDMIVLDEILGSVKAGLIPLPNVLELIREKPPALHLVLTGRGAPPELIEAADLVTEMKMVKHPYQQGIKAQRGIEF
ncbi:MAG: cob(I)yrinic acid a,c-diamide adenosyltransferase [Chloroflexota bacterium]